MARCSVDGCDRPVHGRGWCGRHHRRWSRYGDPTHGDAGDDLAGWPSRWTGTQDAPGGPVELLAEILTGVPALPGAACRGRHELFDTAADDYYAIEVCDGCPARQRCEEWATSQPAGVLFGVVAGRALGRPRRPIPSYRTTWDRRSTAI